jgi:hypothetical protein
MCPATYPSPFSPQVSLQCQASAHIQHPRSRTCPKTLAGLRLPRGPRQHASAQAQGSPVSARASDATGLPGAWLWKVPVPGVGGGRVGAATRPPPTMSCGLVVCADGRRWVPGVGRRRVVSCTRLAVPGGLVTHRVRAPPGQPERPGPGGTSLFLFQPGKEDPFSPRHGRGDAEIPDQVFF